MEDRRIAVVVPTFQRVERLSRLIRALEAQTLPAAEWEAIVVDDCSTDATPRVLDELVASSSINLRSIRTTQRGGPATARNLGWRTTAASLVAFTDDDCVPDPGWLSAGIATLTAEPTIGIVQGRTRRAEGSGGGPDTIRTVIREVSAPGPWFEGCNLFLRRAALEESGGFDEVIAWAGEETAMAWSILERGWERGWSPDAVVVHDVEERSLPWHVRNHYLEGHAVRIAARHPALREAWWRPWAIERRGAFFALAVLGGLAGTQRRSALVLTVPYLADLFPPRSLPPTRRALGWAAYRLVSDAASLAGKATEGIRARTIVL